ncbi:glycosyltransferase family 2 protein, partial [Pseudomonas syringae pv. tagetis]
TVANDWLAEQLALDDDAVCGTVMPGDWNKDISVDAQAAYLQHYKQRDGHRHIHGANLGVSSIAYISAGGFPALTCHGDVH